MNLDDIDTSDLTSDGDTLDVSDRFRLRLRIEADDEPASHHINDADCWGKVSKYAYGYRDSEYRQRPDGFTGRARKIEVARGYIVWWEPYADEYGYQLDDGTWASAKWDQLPRAEIDKQVEYMTDLLRDGFKQVGLTLEEFISTTTQPSIGRWVEVDTAWVGGVDVFYPELIADLAAELPDLEVDA